MTGQQVVPMIHVPDGSVQATVDWYQSIGFTVMRTFADDGEEIKWALMEYGNSRIMVTGGGKPTLDERREVDLYIHTADVQSLFDSMKERVDVQSGLQDTFYGKREFIIRDPNRFWLTFGQDLPSDSD